MPRGAAHGCDMHPASSATQQSFVRYDLQCKVLSYLGTASRLFYRAYVFLCFFCYSLEHFLKRLLKRSSPNFSTRLCLVCLENYIELFQFLYPIKFWGQNNTFLTHFSAAAHLLVAVVQKQGNFYNSRGLKIFWAPLKLESGRKIVESVCVFSQKV